VNLGLAALAAAIRYGEAVALARSRRRSGSSTPSRPRAGTEKLAGVLSESASKALLAGYGISAPPERLVSTPEAAVAAAHEIGFPVVLKLQSADIAHKSEVGGVKLDVRDDEALVRAYEAVIAAGSGARIDGVLVARQVAPVAELIAGIKMDPLFGPVVLVGSGGIFAETIQDTVLRLPPLNAQMVREMLAELRGSAALTGARGRPRADLESLTAVLVALGDIALDFQDSLLELDINPLFALERGALVGDALAVFRS
jgi:acyl-CoA synthetase (NDP forming)